MNTRASELLGLRDDCIALDFDQAAAFRLLQFEAEQAAAMFGKKEDDQITFESVPV